MATFRFDAIGTKWNVAFNLEGREADALMEKIHERIAAFDKAYSRFRADSLVTKMSKEAGTFTLPPDAEPMMNLYFALNKITFGAVTPLIGQALSDAGYDADYSFKEKEMRRPPALSEAIEYHHPQLILKKPTLLDFGAAGKGYLVDIVSAMLKEGGATEGVVDAGGDIATWGNSCEVGLEDPRDTTQAIGIASLKDQSICGSAGNRRAWARFTHVLDPHTLESPRDIAAVWAVAESAILADAMTTALYFVPPASLKRSFEFEYLIMRPDATVEMSARFPAKLFKK